jgi:hypothetical protein
MVFNLRSMNYDLFDFMHHASAPSLAYINKYGEDERDILDNYLFNSDSVKTFLKGHAELDIVAVEDVIIAVGRSSPYIKASQERFLVSCVSVIAEWCDKRADVNEDLDYDPVVRLILELTETVEKMTI